MKKNTTNAPLISYSPEVEAHRAAYEKVAEALIRLHTEYRTSPLQLVDVTSPGWVEPEPDDYILWNGIEHHLRALFENLLACYDDEFMRKLYVELRLFYDEKMLNFKAGMYCHRKGGKQ
jgi:hypothetical protein